MNDLMHDIMQSSEEEREEEEKEEEEFDSVVNAKGEGAALSGRSAGGNVEELHVLFVRSFWFESPHETTKRVHSLIAYSDTTPSALPTITRWSDDEKRMDVSRLKAHGNEVNGRRVGILCICWMESQLSEETGMLDVFIACCNEEHKNSDSVANSSRDIRGNAMQ